MSAPAKVEGLDEKTTLSGGPAARDHSGRGSCAPPSSAAAFDAATYFGETAPEPEARPFVKFDQAAVKKLSDFTIVAKGGHKVPTSKMILYFSGSPVLIATIDGDPSATEIDRPEMDPEAVQILVECLTRNTVGTMDIDLDKTVGDPAVVGWFVQAFGQAHAWGLKEVEDDLGYVLAESTEQISYSILTALRQRHAHDYYQRALTRFVSQPWRRDETAARWEVDEVLRDVMAIPIAERLKYTVESAISQTKERVLKVLEHQERAIGRLVGNHIRTALDEAFTPENIAGIADAVIAHTKPDE